MSKNLCYKTINNKSRAGFTIIELLIVIVVIAILAAIVIVAYNSIRTRVIDTSMKVDGENAAKILANDSTLNNGQYPTTTYAANNNKGLPASPGNTYSYSPNNSVSPQSYTLNISNPGSPNSYIVTSSNNIPTLVGPSPPVVTNYNAWVGNSVPTGSINSQNGLAYYAFYDNTGQTQSMFVTFTGSPTPSIQWQKQPSGGSFSNIIGATSNTYTTPTLNSSNDGSYYRAVLTNTYGTSQTRDTGMIMDYVP